MTARDFFEPGGLFSTSVPDFEYRPSQAHMAEQVEQILNADGILIAEAGTGTGKTLAYLVPALLSGRKVVISTGTKNLQDQIMNIDVPFLEQVWGRSLNICCLKGINNYLCLRKYEDFIHSAESIEPRFAKKIKTLSLWKEISPVGDRAELSEITEEHPIWPKVMSSSETRIGKKCDHYEDCFVTQARERAQKADIVIVNHHLFFADLANRGPHGQRLLPEYDAVIFDEAHQIEEIASLFFGLQFSAKKIERLSSDAEKALSKNQIKKEAGTLIENLLSATHRFFLKLSSQKPKNENVKSNFLKQESRQLLELGIFTDKMKEPLEKLSASLEATAAFLERHIHLDAVLGQLHKRTTQILDVLWWIVDDPSHARVAWIAYQGQSKQDPSLTLGTTPIEIQDILRETLFEETECLIMTSATLTANQSFDFFKSRLGITNEVQEQIFESPFDYPSQSALFLPTHLPDPRDASFEQKAIAQIVELIQMTQGGAFVLCTSNRMMKILHKQCTPRLNFPVLLQGQAPKQNLLAEFKAKKNAVLFATSSFWEGVDVPGEALRLVILDKLPFDVPSDPLIFARCKKMEEQELSPFMDYLVPAAAITLKQGFGRLIRTKQDKGIVALLDSRISKKGYGKRLLKSLPPAKRISDIETLKEFWTAIRESTKD